MTKAQDALKVAQRRIAEAKASDATELALRVDGLEAIPPEISELTGLSSLDLRNTQISDATPLAGLTSLTDLFLSNTQIRDAAPLAGLTSLTDLDLGDTQISDAAPLAGLTSLTILYLNNRQIRDAAPLAGLTSLMGLVLNNTQISDAAPLAGLTSLTHLYLSNTQISDAAPLAGLTNLTDLDLDNTQISDAAPLASLTSLTNLGLSNMQVSDLRPLLPLSNAFGAGVLERLHFAGCAATLLDPELKRLSEIETIEDRTQSTFAYLNSLETWPPAGSKPPEDKVSGDGFAISDRGRLGLAGAGIGDAPDLDELHQDCRDKARALEASLAQTNEHGHIRDASQTYMEVISRHLPAITAHRLWSVGNTLRLSLEAHQASVEDRPTEALPPLIAAALTDLVQTHGLFSESLPETKAVRQAVQDAAAQPRQRDVVEATRALIEALEEAQDGIEAEAMQALAQARADAGGSGPAGDMAKAHAEGTVGNALLAMARVGWKIAGGAVAVGTGIFLADDLALVLSKYWPVIEAFSRQSYGNVPLWLEFIKLALGRVKV